MTRRFGFGFAHWACDYDCCTKYCIREVWTQMKIEQVIKSLRHNTLQATKHLTLLESVKSLGSLQRPQIWWFKNSTFRRPLNGHQTNYISSWTKTPPQPPPLMAIIGHLSNMVNMMNRSIGDYSSLERLSRESQMFGKRRRAVQWMKEVNTNVIICIKLTLHKTVKSN